MFLINILLLTVMKKLNIFIKYIYIIVNNVDKMINLQELKRHLS